ncbi:MAG: threonine aldolase family protein [Propionibacteriaceae bacterium]|jgi:threonine aldolase|nr:threonine aldolase family protein [Propionibacteriaceae bacterium]
MIDLRSDTLTRPTPGMRQAMAEAEVGDDVYGEDPTILALETHVAGLLGHEAGLFTVTGSMSNLLGIWSLARPGQEVLCDCRAHIVRAESGAHAALNGVTTRTWTSSDGTVDAAAIEALLAPNAGPHQVSTAAVELENTHNFGGGTIWPLETIADISALCHSVGVKLHLDGARLWNASVASGVALAEYGELFDTVSVCFSKGLGAPVGSMLLSDADTIARARVQRKRLGGGWRQAGVLAAAALYAVENHVERLAEDHAAARAFAAEVARRAPDVIAVDAVETNIVVLDTGERPAAEIAALAERAQVRVSTVGAHALRAVTHLDVDYNECVEAGRVIGELLA